MLLCAALAMTMLGMGCGLFTLRRDLKEAAGEVALEGQAEVRGVGGNPIAVVAYNTAAKRIVDLFLLPRPGQFFFTLPPGVYQLAAFEDRNRDLTYQPGEEPAALARELILRPAERRAGLDLVIDPSSSTRIPFAVSPRSAKRREIDELRGMHLGTLVSLDDPRFSRANASLGLWHPLRFLLNVGAGVYFLEEYDPNKIPVLFVHGALGNPADWKYLIGTLDRSRFQPWLVYYPTAAHLDRLARELVRGVAALEVKFRFSRFMVVAHSMGGLVARAAVNYAMQTTAGRRAVELPAFVTISSPWDGHAAAADGVKRAPVVAPSWQDLAPGSAFLTGLPRTALPPECDYSLLFSFRPGARIHGEESDGTVAVASELSMPMQRQARRIMGFDESHGSILQSPDMAAQLNAILAQASARR